MNSEDKWILLKKILSKNVCEEPDYKRLAELGSDAFFDNCDYISENYVPPKSGTYFNKQDMIELMREMEEFKEMMNDG